MKFENNHARKCREQMRVLYRKWLSGAEMSLEDRMDYYDFKAEYLELIREKARYLIDSAEAHFSGYVEDFYFSGYIEDFSIY